MYFVVDACFLLLCLFQFFSTQPRDWLRRTFSEMTYFVSGGTRNLNSVNQSLCFRAVRSAISTAVQRAVVSVTAAMLGLRRLFAATVSSVLEADTAAGFTLCDVDLGDARRGDEKLVSFLVQYLLSVFFSASTFLV